MGKQIDGYIAMYEKTTMVPYVACRPGVQRFLVERLFRNVRRFDTDRLLIDIVRKGRSIPVYCKGIDEGNLVEHDGYVTISVRAPYVKERKMLKPGDLRFREPGENEYNATSPESQAVERLNEDFADLDTRLERLEELQAVEVLTTGKLVPKDISGKPLFNDAEIDFKMQDSHKPALSGAAMWKDTTKRKNAIIKDLRDWNKNLLVKDGQSNCEIVVMGSNAYDAFIDRMDPDNESAGLASIRVDRGEIRPELMPEGVMYIGRFPELGGAALYCYAGWYDDPISKTEKPLFPENGVLMVGANARFDRNFGFIENMNALRGIERFPSLYRDPKGRYWEAQLESAPLLSPYEIDKVVFATVC